MASARMLYAIWSFSYQKSCTGLTLFSTHWTTARMSSLIHFSTSFSNLASSHLLKCFYSRSLHSKVLVFHHSWTIWLSIACHQTYFGNPCPYKEHPLHLGLFWQELWLFCWIFTAHDAPPPFKLYPSFTNQNLSQPGHIHFNLQSNVLLF